MKLQRIISELRTRGVIKVASIYAVTAATIIQVLIAVAPIIRPIIPISDNFLTVCVVLSFIFFPVAVYLSWKYEIVPEEKMVRFRTEEPPPKEELPGKVPVGNLQLVKILGPIILGITFLTWISVQWLSSGSSQIDKIKKEKLAVLEFENETGDPELDYIGRMAPLFISQSLAKSGSVNLQASTIQMGEDYIQVLMGKFGFGPDLYRQSGVDNLIIGRYFTLGDSLIILSQIVESITGNVLLTFDQHSAPLDVPWKGIEDLSQQILGYWLTRDNPMFNSDFPRADVYKEYSKATSLIEKDYRLALVHARQCINMDSTFFRAFFLELLIHRRLAQFSQVDSLLAVLSTREFEMNEDEKNMFYHFKSYTRGNNKMAFEYYKNVFERSPGDLYLNIRASILALNLVNSPQQALKIIKKYEDAELDYNDCSYCLDRSNVHITALIDLGKYKKAFSLAKKINSEPSDISIALLAIRALVRLGDAALVERYIEEQKHKRFDLTDGYNYLNAQACIEFAMAGQQDAAMNFGEKVINAYVDNPHYPENDTAYYDNYALGNVYMALKRYDDAEQKYLALLSRGGLNWGYDSLYLKTQIASAKALQGHPQYAQDYLEELSGLDIPYSYGNVAYHAAKIWTALNDKDKAIASVKMAIDEGSQFFQNRFQNDIGFIGIKNDAAFHEILEVY